MIRPPEALLREIRKGGQVYLMVRLITGGLTLLSLMLLTRVLGASEYGRYGYAVSVIALLVTFGQLGLPTQVIRETAAAKTVEQWESARGLWRWSMRNSVLLSLLLSAATGAYYLWRGDDASPAEGVSLPLIALLIPAMTVALNNRIAILRGLRFVGSATVLQSTLPVVALIVIVGPAAFLFGVRGIRAEHVLTLDFAALVVAVLMAVFLIRWRGADRMVATTNVVYRRKQWIAATLPLAVIVGLRTINTNVDVLMLGVWESAADIGIYKIAVRLSTFAFIGEEIIVMVLGPYFARIYADGDTQLLEHICKKAARVSLLLAGGVTAVFVVFGRQILATAFGPEFVASQAPLLILTGGYVVTVCIGAGGTLLNMTGHEKHTARAAMIGTLLNVLLNLILIPMLGIMGAAIATSVSLTASFIVMWLSVRKLMSVRLGVF
jgi:O-antigen/teichoic acid export membrane protein